MCWRAASTQDISLKVGGQEKEGALLQRRHPGTQVGQGNEEEA